MERFPADGAVSAERVLTGLRSLGYPYSPGFLGHTEAGADVLEFVPGKTSTHPAERNETAYGAAGRMLRELHDRTVGTVLAGNDVCLTHGDAGPFNTVFQNGQPVMFIDWDTAAPGQPLADLAYMAWTWCIDANPTILVSAQARRLRELVDGYQWTNREQLLDAIVRRMDDVAASATDPADGKHLAILRWTASDRAHLFRHQRVFREALTEH